MWTKCLPRDTVQPMEAALRNSNEIICKHRKLRLQVPGKVFRESGRRLILTNLFNMMHFCILYPLHSLFRDKSHVLIYLYKLCRTTMNSEQAGKKK